MNLGTKITLCAAGGVVLATAGAILPVYSDRLDGIPGRDDRN